MPSPWAPHVSATQTSSSLLMAVHSPPPGGPVTRAAYTGHEALTFTDYLDLETGRTLHAEPGGVYDIAPASGRAAAEVPEPWFTAIGSGPGEPAPEAWTPEPDAEPEPAPEPDQDHPEG